MKMGRDDGLTFRVGGGVDLVTTDEVEDDAGVGEVDEPVGLVEAEARHDVPGGVVAEGGVPEAAAAEVEESGHGDGDRRRPLHRPVLRRRRLQRVLQPTRKKVSQ